MKKRSLIFLFLIITAFTIQAQQTIVKGSVKEPLTFQPIPEVTITVEGTQIITQTDASGQFIFTELVPLGEQVLRLTKDGYLPARYPIVVNQGKTVNITDMSLEKDIAADTQFTIALSDDELNDDEGGSDNISGLLSSSQDVFQRTAAFEFSPSFFRVRGLDSDNGSVLINGIEMNKVYNGRPQWSNWGGINNVVRNQELTTGLTPSSYNFWGILGTTNINTRASKYREGGRLTYSSSNRSYTNRLMVNYASGQLKEGWAYAFSLGRRWGNEGYQDATLYNSNSFFASIEKRINDKHSINFTSIYTPNRRGKSAPNTQEVYDLKDIKYNEYWGWQDGNKRNSRIKEVDEPILMLNHYWDINSKTTLNTNVGYQFGKIGNSRLDYGGGANPRPTYYQNLPSDFLADGDLAGAYQAEQNFINDGQINWSRIYDANVTNTNAGELGGYVLYEDRTDDKQLTLNTILTSELSENIILNASINYKKLKSENFAEIIDLLGAIGYSNVDSFDGFQYDLQNPDRVVTEGEKFKYNYNLFVNVINGYAQAQFKYNKVDFYVSGSISKTDYQREGLYENGAYPGNNSFGKGKKLNFTGLGAKVGFTYKITGKHLVDVNAGYIIKPPSLRNTYANSRDNHSIVPNITEEKISAIDASYIFRSPIVKAKLTGFYTKSEDANEISYFYSQSSTAEDFIQEVAQGIDKKHIGAEMGIEAQVTPTIKLKGVASLGQYTYVNNPNVYVYSNDIGEDNLGEAKLKDYKLASGAQTAYSIGFEYRDPDYWWFGATANFFGNTYLDISPILRTQSFALDYDGLPFNDYDENVARELLKQEKFDDYMVVNLTGGKSWKIGEYYIGVFASVGNLLDKEYKTGGYEQARRSDYQTLRDESNLPKNRFGPRYWYGRGATYFVNVNFRF